MLILGRLCTFNQPWKPSLKVGRAQNPFLRRKCSFYCILNQTFFSGKNLRGGQKSWGLLPINTPRTMDLPEIKALIKVTFFRNAPQGYRLALNKNIVLYVNCYVKHCCSELSKPKAIRPGFPNWGTCTPRDIFAYLKGYIWFKLAIEGRKNIYTIFISNYLYICICPNRFMLLIRVDKGECWVHTCFLYIWIVYLLN